MKSMVEGVDLTIMNVNKMKTCGVEVHTVYSAPYLGLMDFFKKKIQNYSAVLYIWIELMIVG